jgi:hypothetical protein
MHLQSQSTSNPQCAHQLVNYSWFLFFCQDGYFEDDICERDSYNRKDPFNFDLVCMNAKNVSDEFINGREFVFFCAPCWSRYTWDLHQLNNNKTHLTFLTTCVKIGCRCKK